MFRFVIFIIILLPLVSPAKAGIVVERSRVIIPTSSFSNSLKIMNSNSYPVICKVWVEKGHSAENEDSLIVVKKPFFKMDANEKTTVTLMNLDMDKELALDRESLYWLNIEEIPPKDKDYLHNDILVSLVMHTQLKVFVRPDKLSITPSSAYRTQSFELLENNGKSSLKINNDSPYYITYSNITIKEKSGKSSVVYSGMVSPYSDKEILINNNFIKGAEITYSVISDYGFIISHPSLLI